MFLIYLLKLKNKLDMINIYHPTCGVLLEIVVGF